MAELSIGKEHMLVWARQFGCAGSMISNHTQSTQSRSSQPLYAFRRVGTQDIGSWIVASQRAYGRSVSEHDGHSAEAS
jgi:hypothetical protein